MGYAYRQAPAIPQKSAWDSAYTYSWELPTVSHPGVSGDP